MQPTICYLVSFVASAFLAWAASWLEMRGWRRAADRHWTEQARVLFPARVAVLWNMVAIPTLVTLLMYVLELPVWWQVVALFAYLGGVLGLYPMERALFPGMSWWGWLHLAAVNVVLRGLRWGALAVGAFLMPHHFGFEMLLVTGAYAFLQVLLHRGAGCRLMALLGVLRPARPRLSALVEEVSSALGHRVRRTWELSSPAANAMAFITTNELMFSTALVEEAPDEELKAVCAHEIGHLTESRWITLAREASAQLLGGLIFVGPIHAAYDMPGLIAYLLALWIGWLAMLRLSRLMERRADRVAVALQPGETVYARALERIYRSNRMPAVHSHAGSSSHPHLYDRLLAANFTPDYPRPLPPPARPNSASVFVGLAVLLALVRFG